MESGLKIIPVKWNENIKIQPLCLPALFTKNAITEIGKNVSIFSCSRDFKWNRTIGGVSKMLFRIKWKVLPLKTFNLWSQIMPEMSTVKPINLLKSEYKGGAELSVNWSEKIIFMFNKYLEKKMKLVLTSIMYSPF